MSKGLIIVIVIVILFIAIAIFMISMKSPILNRKQNNCIYNRLVDRYGQVNEFSGKVKFTGTIIPQDMYIYLDPNSFINISNKEIIADDIEITIGRPEITNEFIKIRNDCELSSDKLSIIVVGNNSGVFDYSIRTLNSHAIIFLEKGLKIKNN
jgi:hypothetical protein